VEYPFKYLQEKQKSNSTKWQNVTLKNLYNVMLIILMCMCTLHLSHLPSATHSMCH